LVKGQRCKQRTKPALVTVSVQKEKQLSPSILLSNLHQNCTVGLTYLTPGDQDGKQRHCTCPAHLHFFQLFFFVRKTYIFKWATKVFPVFVCKRNAMPTFLRWATVFKWWHQGSTNQSQCAACSEPVEPISDTNSTFESKGRRLETQ